MGKKRVLVTGAAGYVGSVLCRQLLAGGHEVHGIDVLLFGGESLVPLAGDAAFRFFKGDLCEEALAKASLEGVDAVVHLAAIVGDPACKKHPEEATALMDAGSKQLYRLAQEAGVKHFVFASTCSNYGVMYGDSLLTEYSPLNPQSHYARLKVDFEEFLMNGPADNLPWTILRFATAFGHSPRPRFDLTVNHFTRDMCLGRPLSVFAADLWRPYCHVHDLARAAALCISLGPEKVAASVFNVGDSNMNYTKKEIVEAILPDAPGADVSFQDSQGDDLRNYRVDFSRFAAATGFQVSRSLQDGIRETRDLVRSGLLQDPFDIRHQNA